MNNDLIMMVFDKQQDARKARGALEIMRNSPFLGATNALPLTRDSAGNVVVQIERLPQDQTGPDSCIPDQLVNTIFGESEDEIQKLVAAGLDEKFAQMIKTALDPGRSMILTYVRQESTVDAQLVLEALTQFDGRLYLTTITPQVERVILEAAQKEAK